MKLSVLQQRAVDAWIRGNNVRITAVPGAGKSAVLLEACLRVEGGKFLILSYNRELCRETRQCIADLGKEDTILCMTFHGLATFCVAPAADDIALHDVIDFLEKGNEPLQKIKDVRHILIDEAQDFRPSFARLVPLLVHIDKETQFMVVGDPMQMLYDYHEDDAASLTYLEEPWQHFRSEREWTSVVLDETYRLTPEMARFLSAAFGREVKSAHPERALPAPVEVYTVNAWAQGGLLVRLLKRERPEDCCILVARKKNNGPLRATLNRMSKDGYAIHVHGVDGQDPRVRANKLSVSTWHAAKGTQRPVCVVLGVEDDDNANPAYVALSRGQRRLIVVLDRFYPSQRVLSAMKRVGSRDVTPDYGTRQVASEIALTKDVYQPKRDLISLDGWRPCGSGRWLTDLIDVEIARAADEVDDDSAGDIVEGASGAHEDVAAVYKLACLMEIERERTGTVRRWSDINSPARLARTEHKNSIDDGSSARFVPPNIPGDALLDAETQVAFHKMTQKQDLSTTEMCFIACACLAWNGFHHSLRQMQPYQWMSETKFRRGVATARFALRDDEEVTFDARIRVCPTRDQTMHARVDASSAAAAYEFVWSADTPRGAHIDAAIKACMHASGICYCVNLKSGQVEMVRVKNRDAVLARLAQAPSPRASGGSRDVAAASPVVSGQELKRKACDGEAPL